MHKATRTRNGVCGSACVRRAGVPAEQLGLYRRRLADCFGLDADKQAAAGPVQLLVVDRYYGSGVWMLYLKVYLP